MADNFAQSLAAVLEHEGGYVNHPRDPGRATNFGVTQRTYDAWRQGQGKSRRSVRLIDQSEVRAIYKAQYWDAVKADRLPDGLDYCVFDFAVNSGPARAAKFLQLEVGAEADGFVGEQTLAAVRRVPSLENAISNICGDRLRWLRTLSHWDAFGRGWTRRVNQVEARALSMAQQPEPPKDYAPPDAPEPPKGVLAAILAALAGLFVWRASK